MLQIFKAYLKGLRILFCKQRTLKITENLLVLRSAIFLILSERVHSY